MIRHACAAALLVSTLCAQGKLALEPCGGAIGQNITYRVSGGKAAQRFAFLTSLRRQVIPLRIFDPGETRSLGVGLDQVSVMRLPTFDGAGRWSFTLRVPNTPPLAGLGFLHQAVSFGTTSFFDRLSDVAVVVVDPPNRWKVGANSMSATRSLSTLIPLLDGRVLIVGGGGGWLMWQEARDTTEIFDPFDRTFTAGPRLSVGRSSHTQTRLRDGRYLLVGGVTQNPKYGVTNTCEIYDPRTGRLTNAARMNGPRCLHTASLLPNGRVIVIGGYKNVSTNVNWAVSQVRTTEIYNPINNRWVNGPNMRLVRAGHGAVPIGNGRLLVMGGLSYVGRTTWASLTKTCEIYDPARNWFRPAAAMSTARVFFGSTALAGRKVLVAGGLSGQLKTYPYGTATRLCEVYDAATNRWSPAASLPLGTSGAATIALRDGRFALVGGGTASLTTPSPTSLAVAYNPTTARWDGLQGMVTGRVGAMGIELQSCGLLVLGGGVGRTGKATDTYEMLIR